MSFKTSWLKYNKAYRQTLEAEQEIKDFFERFDLSNEFGVSNCAGDGVLILDVINAQLAQISEDQINALSKARTREKVLEVLNSLSFNF